MGAIDSGPVSAEKTMELLWTRVRQRGDLPGFSKVVSAIIGAMRGDDDREFSMTKTVLQDPALTQKVLRLANSAMYSVFGQGINTVSKAVIVLGTEAIGHLALGLKLIDGLSGAAAGSEDARAEMEKAVLAGHIARQVASSASTRDAEEAVVCSMLHSLGRMMAAFYLPEQWEQVRVRCAAEGGDEHLVAQQVLGLGFDDIGRNAARQWGLPAGLVNTLQDVPPKSDGEPLDHNDWLAAVATLSSRCADALCSPAPQHAGLQELAGSYAEMLGLEAEQLILAVEAAQRTAADEDAIVIRTPKKREDNKPEPPRGKPADAVHILNRGVADMRGAMDGASVTQLVTMGLETVYQGLCFSRSIAFVRHPERHLYAAQMGFGDGVQELLAALAFADAYQPDVFHAALANDKMIFVENARDAAFSSKLPRWWKDGFPTSRSFMVLPLTVNRRPAGFIYGDWDMDRPMARIEQPEIAPLNELRTLIMRAMEQQRLMDASFARRLR